MEREWSHVLLLLRREDNYPQVSAGLGVQLRFRSLPQNLDPYPKLLSIYRGLCVCSWLSQLPEI